ncbi:MAG TPA: DUF2917 domain-containing protein [Caldimonas sp.]|nr:DUF2917 domain-containing protein [Caldimonas sp.]HEX2539661.1 DUF2917 domain-containing protein [Caldimonas sp.]
MTLTFSHAGALAVSRARALPAAERHGERSPAAASCTLSLDGDRAARPSLRLGTRLECLSGRAWITLDGDLRDVLLERGESFVVDRKAPVMVFAVGAPAALRVHAPAVPRTASLSGWRARVACVVVVAVSSLAWLGAHFAVADLSDRAAAVSLPTAADGAGRAADARTPR